jgi:hypothetical protein
MELFSYADTKKSLVVVQGMAIFPPAPHWCVSDPLPPPPLPPIHFEGVDPELMYINLRMYLFYIRRLDLAIEGLKVPSSMDLTILMGENPFREPLEGVGLQQNLCVLRHINNRHIQSKFCFAKF